MQSEGRARDLFTSSNGDAVERESVALAVTMSPQREILTIASTPAIAAIGDLTGVRAGGKLRGAIRECLPIERREATCLHLLLDDMAGASLVAGWCFSRWADHSMAGPRSGAISRSGQMEGICAGFRPGSTALAPDGTARHEIQSSANVLPLPNPVDRLAFHALPEDPLEPSMRRARWQDLRREGTEIVVAMGFQDSATNSRGGRTAVHEYRVLARVSAADMVLQAIEVEPLVLPYGECPAAAQNVDRMIGKPVANFRDEVLVQLKGTAGCTHLNDILRMLGDVPKVASCLT